MVLWQKITLKPFGNAINKIQNGMNKRYYLNKKALPILVALFF